jgi:hypothetical protein
VYALGLIAAVQVLALGSAPSASQVRAAFLHAWQGYRRYAWGHDDLDQDISVQVFEVTIRLLGGLLSGTRLCSTPRRTRSDEVDARE